MKLEESKSAFYDATEQLSENVRNLSFAGIAIVWVFRVGDQSAGGIPFSRELLWPLGLFALCLLLDLVQYLYKSLAWRSHYSYHRKRGISDDTEVDAPSGINFPAFLLFYAKLGSCALGFVYLLGHITVSLV